MPLRSLKFLFASWFFLLLGCSPAGNEGLLVNSSLLTRHDSGVQVGGIEINSSDLEKIGTELKLLTEPGQFGCEGFYASTKGKLYFFQDPGIAGSWFLPNGPGHSSPLSSAEFAHVGNCYFRNEEQVFYEGLLVKMADLATFRPLDAELQLHQALAVDAHNVYADGQMIPADPATYEVLDLNYRKDKDRAYFLTRPIRGADPASFQVLGENYAKDQRQVYFHEFSVAGFNGPVAHADPESFQVLKHHYLAKDKSAVYYKGRKTEVSHAPSFEIIKNNDNDVFYGRDKNFVYFDLRKMPEIDVETFEVATHDFASDRRSVFYRGKQIMNADPGSHQILNMHYSKDRQRVFYMGKEIPGADPSNFQILEDGYSKDFNNVFYRGEKMMGADVSTFQIFQDVTLRAQDKNYVYYDGKIIHSSDTNAPAKPDLTLPVLPPMYESLQQKFVSKPLGLQFDLPSSFMDCVQKEEVIDGRQIIDGFVSRGRFVEIVCDSFAFRIAAVSRDYSIYEGQLSSPLRHPSLEEQISSCAFSSQNSQDQCRYYRLGENLQVFIMSSFWAADPGETYWLSAQVPLQHPKYDTVRFSMKIGQLPRSHEEDYETLVKNYLQAVLDKNLPVGELQKIVDFEHTLLSIQKI